MDKRKSEVQQIHTWFIRITINADVDIIKAVFCKDSVKLVLMGSVPVAANAIPVPNATLALYKTEQKMPLPGHLAFSRVIDRHLWTEIFSGRRYHQGLESNIHPALFYLPRNP